MQSFETECGGIRSMKDIENCPFEPSEVGDERPTFGKRMIVEKVRQVEPRVKYRWLRWGMLQQVLLDQGREVIRSYHCQRGRKSLPRHSSNR